MERRLAAILAADVAGYTALMGADEAGTLRRLTDVRRDFLEPLIDEHHGRVVKLMGDGLLVEFASVVDAVTCALAWQIGLLEREAGAEDGKALRFRIGINLGDVIVEGDDIHGDGVNIAARLEGLAEPGGICLSDDAYRQAKGKIEAGFENLGERKLKNVAEPVRVYRVTTALSLSSNLPPARTILPLPDKPSIVVLPFTNMSGDPEQEYFADGVVEDIITGLSKFRWFFVIARNTSFTYKGKSVSVQEVGRELGVQYLLDGGVRKAGNRVRITAQLIDATTGKHVWAERYERKLADIFDLQDEIAATIVGVIEPEIGDQERDRARRKPPENLDAWDRYQRGLWHYWRRTSGDADEAENLFISATKLDPGFSSAHAGLAEVCYIKLYHGWTNCPDETLQVGLRAAQQAVSLDDKDALAHFALGRIHLLGGDLETAIAELKIALNLNSNLGIAYYGLGMALLWSGEAREALPFFHKAIRHSPNDPLLFGFEVIVGVAQFQLGEYGSALDWCKKAARHPTSSFWVNTYMAAVLVKLNQLEEARSAVEVALRKQPGLSLARVSKMLSRMHPRYLDRILDALRKAGLSE